MRKSIGSEIVYPVYSERSKVVERGSVSRQFGIIVLNERHRRELFYPLIELFAPS